ncbi:hypothetical protein [Gemmobacter sp. 24YEA27]|uniref:hypothetical protein n=1 Tax=Gemmobacter sp. 24YEA27 TaxID=3040672 RepID=UPI0024B349AF|nr:hypothetical protein [Gemmobacter sp. 24YEA27]
MPPVLAFSATSWRPASPRRLIEAAVDRLDRLHGIGAETCDLLDAGPALPPFVARRWALTPRL